MRTNLNATTAFTPYCGPAGMFGLAADRRVFDAEDGSGGGAPGGNGETAEQKAAREAAEAAAKAKNQPSDGEAKLLKELMAKKDEAAKLKTDLETLQNQLKTFEGIDPEQVRALLAKQAEAEAAAAAAAEEAALKRGEFDRIKQGLIDAHNAALQAKQLEVDNARTETTNLQKRIDSLTVGSAFAGSTYIKNDLVLTPTKAQALYEGHFDIADGRLTAYDKPRGATDRTPLVDARGNALAFDDAFKKIVEADPDHNTLLRSKMKSGAGSDAGNGGKGPNGGGGAEGAGVSRISAALKGGTFSK